LTEIGKPMLGIESGKNLIGARPTRSSISLVFSVENAPAAPSLAQGTRCATGSRALPVSFQSNRCA
jgi:hypothetical protein